MDHRFIEEHDIADRYWTGKLSGEDEQAFELHLMDCRECVARVQEFEGLRAGLEQVPRVPPPMWGAGWRIAAIAAGIVGLVAAGTAYVFQQQLTASRQELAAVQRRAPNPATPSPALTRASLYRLEIVRGEASPNRVFVPANPEPIVFSVRFDPVPGATKYRASLLEKSGLEKPDAMIAEQGELAMDSGTSLVLTFPSDVLRPGDYILRVEASSPSGHYFEVASYPFQARPKP